MVWGGAANNGWPRINQIEKGKENDGEMVAGGFFGDRGRTPAVRVDATQVGRARL